MADINHLGWLANKVAWGFESLHPYNESLLMEKQIDKVIRESFNKYIVRHVPIKNDTRCRTEIMFEEMVREVMKVVNENKNAEMV